MPGMYLPNAYHHAGVGVPRAKSYAVGGRVASSAFARGAAFERMVQRRRAAGLRPEVPKEVRVAWRNLAMGDLNAVCFMTTAHLNLLRRHGAARELMRYRSPVPRGPLKEGIIVDDYDMMCVVPRTMRADEPAEDTKALSRARQPTLPSASVRRRKRHSLRRRTRIFGAQQYKARSGACERIARLRFVP